MEELLLNPFTRLPRDILADIVARLDGPALAAASCTCNGFLQIAREHGLWRQLCNSTWPSTQLEEAQSFLAAGFGKFYGDSYPLVSHIKGKENQTMQAQNSKQSKPYVSPSDFASLIDVYYREKCVLSRVLDGIPEAVDIDKVGDDDRQRWFSDCPFKLDLLSYNYDEEDDRHEDPNEGRRGQPSTTEVEDGKWKEDRCSELANDLRLSWVLLDKKTGNAVNLSSLKPIMVQRSWPTEGDYMISFGCIVPVDENVLPQKLAKCTIITRCKLGEKPDSTIWKEISMIIEDMNGAHLSGRKSSLVLNQALYSSQTTNLDSIEKGFIRYEKQKKEMKKRKEFVERMVDSFCLSLEVTAFVTFCYVFKLL